MYLGGVRRSVNMVTNKIEAKGGGMGAYENNLIKCIQNSVTMKLTDTEKNKEEKNIKQAKKY